MASLINHRHPVNNICSFYACVVDRNIPRKVGSISDHFSKVSVTNVIDTSHEKIRKLCGNVSSRNRCCNLIKYFALIYDNV